MNKMRLALIHGAIALLAGIALLSCNIEDINEEVAPVELIANVTNVLTVLDLADADCPSPTVEFELRAIVKDTTLPGGGLVDTRFLDVIVRMTRTSFVRTDGGTVVPRTFVESIDMLVPVGGSPAELPPGRIFAPGALDEAPFVALRPLAGGRDPETGRNFVSLDVIQEFFGETLSGERVSTSVRYPLVVCIDCGGCQPE